MTSARNPIATGSQVARAFLLLEGEDASPISWTYRKMRRSDLQGGVLDGLGVVVLVVLTLTVIGTIGAAVGKLRLCTVVMLWMVVVL